MMRCLGRKTTSIIVRSEEHTSELQSLRHLVCRLLLEKKKALVEDCFADVLGDFVPDVSSLCEPHDRVPLPQTLQCRREAVMSRSLRKCRLVVRHRRLC